MTDETQMLPGEEQVDETLVLPGEVQDDAVAEPQDGKTKGLSGHQRNRQLALEHYGDPNDPRTDFHLPFTDPDMRARATEELKDKARTTKNGTTAIGGDRYLAWVKKQGWPEDAMRVVYPEERAAILEERRAVRAAEKAQAKAVRDEEQAQNKAEKDEAKAKVKELAAKEKPRKNKKADATDAELAELLEDGGEAE